MHFGPDIAAPLQWLVVMLCMGFVFSLPVDETAALAARTRQVMAAFRRASYRIESWVGEDVEVPGLSQLLTDLAGGGQEL